MPVALLKPYCTLEDVQSITGADDPDVEDRLRTAINSASRMVDELTGRDFWYHDHSDTPYVVPRRCVSGELAALPYPIITLTAASLDGVAEDLSALAYEVGECSIVRGSAWGDYPFTGKLELTGTFGYLPVSGEGGIDTAQPPPLLPESIRRATSLMAAAFSNEWRKERVLLDGTRENLSETRVPSEARQLIARYDIRGRFSVF